MREITVTLPNMPPIAWQRPGQSRFGRYDKQKSIKDALGAIITINLGIHTPLTGPVELRAIFIFSGKKDKVCSAEKLGTFHYFRPDLDNLLKFYLDLCKDCQIYEDDCQVCRIIAEKRYPESREEMQEGVILKFRELDVRRALDEDSTPQHGSARSDKERERRGPEPRRRGREPQKEHDGRAA